MSLDVELSSLPARINLYLNSANRTSGDSASSFEMTMSNTLVTADTNEIFFLNVIQFNTFNNFYQVQKGYNTDFQILIYDKDNVFHDSIIGEIPEGNLTVHDILNYLSVLLSGIINISYDKIKNKFIFTTISSNSNHAYIYLNIINCDLLLGFSRLKRLKPILLGHNINIYSEQPINVISITNIFVHVSGDLYLNDENYDNHNSSEVDNNNIIFSMAVDKPFNTCSFGRRGALARAGGLGTCARTAWASGRLGCQQAPPSGRGQSLFRTLPQRALQKAFGGIGRLGCPPTCLD